MAALGWLGAVFERDLAVSYSNPIDLVACVLGNKSVE